MRYLFILFLFFAVPSYAQTVKFQDTFTEASGDVLLVNHTPDTGSSWEQTQASADTVCDPNCTLGQVRSTNDVAQPYTNSNNSDKMIYCALPTTAYSTSDKDIEASIASFGGSSDDPQCLCDGVSDASNYYCACVYPTAQNPDLKLIINVAGSKTTLTADAGATTGDCIKFERRTASKKVYVQTGCTGGWTQHITSANNDITATGKACLAWGNVTNVATDDIHVGAHWDNFKVTEFPSGAAGQVMRIQ